MNILHIVPTYIPAYRASGPINVTHGMNKWLVRNGAKVTVYTTNADGPREQLKVPLGIPVDIDGVRVFYFPTSFPRRWYYSRELRRKLAASIGDFDVVHITSAFLAASTVGAHAAVRANVPFLLSVYGTFMRAPLRHRTALKRIYLALIERWNLAHADLIHFASVKEHEEYDETGLPARRTAVIASGADPEVLGGRAKSGSFRAKFGIGPEQKVILFLGRFHWIKGHDTLIPAFAAVAQQNPAALLVLAGYDDGGYRKEIGRMIDAAKIQDRVMVTGALFGDDKAAAFMDSDVFVLPSYTEAASIASIEALFFGLPIVITENCGFAKEIGAAGAGMVVAKEIGAVAEAIRGILADPARAARMRMHARAFFDRELTLDRVAKKFLEVYAGIIKDHSRQ